MTCMANETSQTKENAFADNCAVLCTAKWPHSFVDVNMSRWPPNRGDCACLARGGRARIGET